MANAQIREVEHDVHAHPGVREYVNIATVLTVVTAIEVGLYFVESLSHLTLVILLMILMVLKFVLVVGWYMHLKFDNIVLTVLFTAGLLISASIVISLAALFGVFGGTPDIVRETGMLAPSLV